MVTTVLKEAQLHVQHPADRSGRSSQAWWAIKWGQMTQPQNLNWQKTPLFVFIRNMALVFTHTSGSVSINTFSVVLSCWAFFFSTPKQNEFSVHFFKRERRGAEERRLPLINWTAYSNTHLEKCRLALGYKCSRWCTDSRLASAFLCSAGPALQPGTPGRSSGWPVSG